MKRFIAGILISALTILPLQATPTPIKSTTVKVSITGTMLDITVPTAFTVKLNPNATTYADMFIVPEDMTLTNETNSPINMRVDIVAKTGAIPIVEAGTFATEDSWKALSTAETNANIALGFSRLTPIESSNWFTVQAGKPAGFSLGRIEPKGTIKVKPIAKYGTSFSGAKDIEYSVTFTASLVP